MIFSKMKVGKRLAVGFGAALLLLLTISVASELTIRSIAADTANLLEQQLQTERLVTEWKGIIEANVQRAQAAAKATDPEVQKFFQDGIARTSKRAVAAQEQIGKLLIDPKAKELFAKAMENRDIYQGHRKAALDSKADGDLEKTNAIIEQKFLPACDAYVGSIGALAERQKSAIDEIGDSIRKRSEGAVIAILIVALASIAVALALGWLITRSLLIQLGGEPDYAAGITDRIAAGDLTVDVALRANDRSSLLFSIATMRDRLAAIVGEVRSTTDAVATASNEIASGNMDLSTRTEQQAGSLEETASSMEELTSTVKQNTDHARQANQLAASAAKDIKHLIDDSVGKIDDGARLVGQAGDTMTEIVASVRRVSDIMGQIATASGEQEAGIEQINQAIVEMDGVTQQNAALVEQAAAAADALQGQSGHLAQLVSMFKLDARPVHGHKMLALR